MKYKIPNVNGPLKVVVRGEDFDQLPEVVYAMFLKMQKEDQFIGIDSFCLSAMVTQQHLLEGLFVPTHSNTQDIKLKIEEEITSQKPFYFSEPDCFNFDKKYFKEYHVILVAWGEEDMNLSIQYIPKD